jgi:tRNA-modifying protein YgfZ
LSGAGAWRSAVDAAGAVRGPLGVRHFGEPRAEAAAVLGGEVVADLGPPGVIRVTGESARDFLQGQLCADVADADGGAAPLTAWLSPKGRVLTLLRLLRSAEGYVLLLPPDRVEEVLRRLQLYVLRARVRLEAAGAGLGMMGLAGRGTDAFLASVLGAAPLPEPGHATEVPPRTLVRLAGDDTIPPAYLVLAPPGDLLELWTRRREAGAVPVGREAWSLLEIRGGVPELGAGQHEAFLPQMLNLPDLGGVSFSKGCYVGQEIVARTQYLGRLKRRLYRLRVGGDQAPSPGDSIHVAEPGGDLSSGPLNVEPEGREDLAGEVVRVAPLPEEGFEVLAVLRIDAAEGGGLRLNAQAASIEQLGPKRREDPAGSGSVA